MYSRIFNYTGQQSIFLFGPRGVGKTRWLKARFPHALYFDLLDSDVFTRLLAAPNRLADLVPKNFTDWIVLDEVQKIPEILNEVHRLIETCKYRFLLTGSSARKLKAKGTNLLAGRALTKYMHPLVAAELGSDFSVMRAIKFGCLPSVYTVDNPAAYLKSYITTYLKEEVQQEGLTRNLAAFSRCLEALSFSQASVLNVAAIARDCSVNAKVVADYITILEDLLIAVRIPVFTRRAKRDLAVHPKFYFFDAGVFGAVRPRGPLDADSEIAGAALETLVLQHLRAINDYKELGYGIYFWRTRLKQEVDFVLYGERGLIGIEVTHSSRVRGDDLSGLKLFKEDYPEARTILFYAGEKNYFESGVEVVGVEEGLRGLDGIL